MAEKQFKDRAFELLKKGCMPFCPPARRNWKSVQPIDMGSSLSWPPKDYEKMKPDAKLLEREFVVMLIEKVGTPVNHSRNELLDKYNFLALDGEGETKGPVDEKDKVTMRCLVAILFLGLVYGQSTVDEVAFSAGLTHDATFNNGEVVPFNTQYTNIGGGYDTTTGIFTCPKAGIYLFQYHMVAHLDAEGWLELYHNAYYINSAYSHTGGDYGSSGNSAILKLSAGDTVSIKAVSTYYGYSGTQLYGQTDEIYSTFSGYILAPVGEEIAIGK
ncbi:positive regulation of adiponectin secretion [Mactra antiquata]